MLAKIVGSLRPIGNQPSSTQKTMSSRMANQKSGMLAPLIDTTRMMWSGRRLRRAPGIGAERDAEGDRDQAGGDRQLQRGGELVGKHLRHRRGRDARPAEVAGQHAARPVEILHRQRVVRDGTAPRSARPLPGSSRGTGRCRSASRRPASARTPRSRSRRSGSAAPSAAAGCSHGSASRRLLVGQPRNAMRAPVDSGARGELMRALLVQERELEARPRPERLHGKILHPVAVRHGDALLRGDDPHRVVEQDPLQLRIGRGPLGRIELDARRSRSSRRSWPDPCSRWRSRAPRPSRPPDGRRRTGRCAGRRRDRRSSTTSRMRSDPGHAPRRTPTSATDRTLTWNFGLSFASESLSTSACGGEEVRLLGDERDGKTLVPIAGFAEQLLGLGEVLLRIDGGCPGRSRKCPAGCNAG